MYADVGDLRMSAMVAAAHVMAYLGQPNGGCGTVVCVPTAPVPVWLPGSSILRWALAVGVAIMLGCERSPGAYGSAGPGEITRSLRWTP